MLYFRLFRLLWNVMWRVVTPLLLLTILSATFSKHKPLSYESGEEYPWWARALGWVVTAASVSAIPTVAVGKIAVARGNLFQVSLSRMFKII